jgi:ribonuclease-3
VSNEEEPVGRNSGEAPGAVDAPVSSDAPEARLRELLDQLPPDLDAPVFTHSSWTTRRSDSYERLAFLGDSVLSLAITAHLYPRLAADRFGAGRLTKIRAQAVSGRSCRAVAERLGVPDRLRAAAPPARRRSSTRSTTSPHCRSDWRAAACW